MRGETGGGRGGVSGRRVLIEGNEGGEQGEERSTNDDDEDDAPEATPDGEPGLELGVERELGPVVVLGLGRAVEAEVREVDGKPGEEAADGGEVDLRR